jgi:predicted transposase/invertase (TIGR01784 family)
MFESSYGDGFGDGKKIGLQEGIEKGRNQEKLEIARNLLDILDIEMIMQKTGLSQAEIEQLRGKK